MRRILALSTFVATVLVGSGTVHAQTFRGTRYCEVIAVMNDGGSLRVDVYNSLPFNLCPQEAWDLLDAESVRAELGALLVLLNGPRFFLMDAISGAPNEGPEVLHTFGTILMRIAATVDAPAGGLSPGSYVERSVIRDTSFDFHAGSEVYELIDPQGHLYVMQSYAHIVDGTLDEAALALLGDRLALPPGWSFRVRTLPDDLVVVDQAGIATVVQDELDNTYQLAGTLVSRVVEGGTLDVRQRPSGAQRFKFRVRSPLIAADSPCSTDGELVIEAVGESAPWLRLPLNSDLWKPIGDDLARGCRYRLGPVVRTVQVEAGGLLKVTAAGADLGIPLTDDPRPVRIELRHGTERHCFEFGDSADAIHRSGKRLRARRPTPATVCPAEVP